MHMMKRILGLTSAVFLALTAGCLLTKDFPTPGMVPLYDLLSLVVSTTPTETSGQTGGGTIGLSSIGDEEVLYVEGFKAVWFDLTERVELSPGGSYAISVDVKSKENTSTIYFHVKVQDQLLYSKNEEVETSWKEVRLEFKVPSELSDGKLTLHFGIEVAEDAKFYIRKLNIIPILQTGEAEAQ